MKLPAHRAGLAGHVPVRSPDNTISWPGLIVEIPSEKSCYAIEGSGVLDKKQVSPFKQFQPCPRNLFLYRLEIRGCRDAVVPASTDVHGQPQGGEPSICIVTGPGPQLSPETDEAAGFVCFHPQTLQGLVKQRLELYWIGCLPHCIPAGVTELEDMAHVVLKREVSELVQGIRSSACTTTAGASQGQTLYSVWIAQSKLLRHHASERDAHHQATIPPHGVEQGIGIVGIVGHSIGYVRARSLTQTALIIRENLEMPGNWHLEDIG